MRFDIVKHKLSNGLKILCMEDHSSPAISYQVHFAVGSRNERQGIIGISHLFEHLMFRGSKELGPEELSRIIQANGGSINAFTSKDNTSYYENLPSNKLELAVRLEAERLENLRLDQENLDVEREVVRDERKLRTVNSPYGLVIEQLYLTSFVQHPYRWPVVGFDSNLIKINLKDCLEFYRIYYAPNNAVIVIVGDIKADYSISLIEKYYGHLKKQDTPDDIRNIEPTQRGERRVVFKKVSMVEALFAGYHIPGIHSEDSIAAVALSNILSSGKSSRFYKKYIQPGRVIELGTSAGFPPFMSIDPGLFGITLITPLKSNIKGIEQEIWDDIENIKLNGPSEDELQKAKKQIRSHIIRMLQTQFNKGLVIGMGQIYSKNCHYIENFLEKLSALTVDMLQDVAAKYLIEDNRTVVQLLPIAESDSAKLGSLI